MSKFYCYTCDYDITHDKYIADDLVFGCNLHGNIYLNESNLFQNCTNKINTVKNNVNTTSNVYETIASYNNKDYDKKIRTCSIIYDYLINYK